MITLRLLPHQVEAQTAIAAHFAAGGQRGLIKAFCGAGKSLMMTDSHLHRLCGGLDVRRDDSGGQHARHGPARRERQLRRLLPEPHGHRGRYRGVFARGAAPSRRAGRGDCGGAAGQRAVDGRGRKRLRTLLERHFVIKETKGHDERFLYFYCAHKEEE